MAKVINVKGNSIAIKVKTISKIFFGKLSDSELALLVLLVEENGGSPINLTAGLSHTLRTRLKMNENTFSGSLLRLNKKGALIKDKGVINLYPVFHNLAAEDKFSIRFTAVIG